MRLSELSDTELSFFFFNRQEWKRPLNVAVSALVDGKPIPSFASGQRRLSSRYLTAGRYGMHPAGIQNHAFVQEILPFIFITGRVKTFFSVKRLNLSAGSFKSSFIGILLLDNASLMPFLLHRYNG